MQKLEQQLQQALKECEQLRQENQLLKALLKYHNIQPNTNHPLQNTKLKFLYLSNRKLMKELRYLEIFSKVERMFM